MPLRIELLEDRVVLNGGALPTGPDNGIIRPFLLPAISVVGGPLNLGLADAGIPGTAQNYTVSGSNLTSAITVTAPTGTEASTDNSTWSSSLTLPQTSGTVASTTIYVRIAASASVGTISANVTNTATGATELDVAVSGTVDAAIPSITASPSSVALGTASLGSAGTSQSFTVSGSNLVGNLVVVAPAGVEVSGDSGTTWYSSILFTPTSGTVASSTVMARIAATAPTGFITNAIVVRSTEATSLNVSVTGAVNTASPTIAGTVYDLPLGVTSSGNASTPVPFTAGGTGLTANLVVTAPTGVEISDNGGSSWSSSLTFTPVAQVVPLQSLLARIKSTATVGSITGVYTTIASTGATTWSLSTTGIMTADPAVSVSTSSLALRTTTQGQSSVPQTFTVSGTNLSGDVVLNAPSGVELSTDATTWSSSLTLPESAQSAAGTIYVRISASASPGDISGNITIASTSVTTQNVSVTGTVSVAPSPTVTSTASSIYLGATPSGTSGSYNSVNVGELA